MLILLTAIFTLSSSVNGDGREIFPVHDDGQDINHHFLRARLDESTPARRVSTRIAGGHNAKPGHFPYIVQIRLNGQYHCAGALIHGHHDNQVVLTTAECVTEPMPSNEILNFDSLSIIGGKYYMEGSYFYEQTRKPYRIVRHEHWNREKIIRDLAVVFLDFKFELNALVHTIELPENVKYSYPPKGYPLTVAGWGLTKEGQYSEVLKTMRLPTLLWQDCHNAYHNYDYARHIEWNTTLCGWDEKSNGHRNLCQGDWGAPARAFDNGTEYLAGIFSWTEAPCGENNFPSLFQKMWHFRSWIYDTSISFGK